MPKYLVRVAREIELVEVQQVTVEASDEKQAAALALERLDSKAWSIDEDDSGDPYVFLTLELKEEEKATG